MEDGDCGSPKGPTEELLHGPARLKGRESAVGRGRC